MRSVRVPICKWGASVDAAAFKPKPFDESACGWQIADFSDAFTSIERAVFDLAGHGLDGSLQ
jgi:hypothetical protein